MGWRGGRETYNNPTPTAPTATRATGAGQGSADEGGGLLDFICSIIVSPEGEGSRALARTRSRHKIPSPPPPQHEGPRCDAEQSMPPSAELEKVWKDVEIIGVKVSLPG